MSFETKSKSFLIHELKRLQDVVHEKDSEIALLKEIIEKPSKQPAGTIIAPEDVDGAGAEPKSVKKRKFGFEKDFE